MYKTVVQKGIQTRKAIYEAIVSYTQEHLYPPSVREIADMVGLGSTSTVQIQLKKLEADGRIEIESFQPRCIRLVGFRLVEDGK